MARITWRHGMAAVLLAALCCRPACAQDQMAAGKKLFTQTAVPACAVCHTLAHAGAKGDIGPDLDELRPDAARVEKAMRNGIGQMPPFARLSDEQIQALARYVESAAASGK